MTSSKTNWNFKCFLPSFLLLAASVCTVLSFLIFQASSLVHWIVGGILLIYLIILLCSKFSELKLLILTGVVIFSIFAYQRKTNTTKLTLDQPIKINCDQIKINQHFMTGQGKIGNRKVLISLKTNPEVEYFAKRGETFCLANYKAEINEVERATNPGEFDFRKYYLGKGIVYRLQISEYELAQKKLTLIDKIHYFRFKIQEYLKQLPKLTAFLASEMILAENPSKDNKQILNNYRDLGVIHLLSISGLHVSLYTLGIGLLATLCKRTEKEAVIYCLVFLGIEVLLSDFQPGFLRASLSYGYGKLFSKHKVPITSSDKLGLVALTHLVINPSLFLLTGAILSYLLVLGIEITKKLSGFKQGISLNLLIMPLLLHYFYQINVCTSLFNLIIVPIFNFILLPLTFISILIFPIMPLAVDMIEKLFQIIMGIIDWLAKMEIGKVTFGQINWWQTLILVAISGYLLIFIDQKRKRKFSIKFLILSYGILFCTIHLSFSGQVAFIDVGQGDSILITTPLSRRSYLIDTGGKLKFGNVKNSEPQINKVTIPLLKSKGINTLDGVFLSHQDADHIGDLAPLLEQVKVKKLYFAQGLTDNPSFQRKISGKVNETKLVPLIAGDRIKEPGISFQVVYPFEPGLGKNEDSLSLFFELSNKKWLMTGDLDQEGEKKIIERYPLKVDYFKLGHHGSKTSSNIDFLKQIGPQMVFISSGRKNRFGHPHPETLKTLNELNLPYLNTQDSGTITWTYSIFGMQRFETFLKKEK